MLHIKCRDILAELASCPSADTLLFMGGSSKNGPEYLFRKELRKRGIPLVCTSDRVPKAHSLVVCGRTVRTVSLTSPSNAANRAIGSTRLFKARKAENPSYSTFDYRCEQYAREFLGE
jgi:hypothetical protein